MKRNVNGVLLLEASIDKVSFSESKEQAYLEFSDDNVTFEFRNGKMKRADHIRKLKLLKGERVVVVGSPSSSSPLYGYGFDLYRVGKVNDGCYSVYKGHVLNIVHVGCQYSVIYLQHENKKNIVIKANNQIIKHIKIGEEIAVLCYQKICYECMKPCEDWSIRKCSCCKLRNSEKRFTAIEIERS